MGPEAKIQQTVVKYARMKYLDKIIVVKRQGGRYGSGGMPDYDFFRPGGGVMMIEFKAPGGGLTPRQEEMIRRLKKLGVRVHVCDNAVQGCAMVDDFMRGVIV